MASYFPLIGAWFKDNETGQRFEIVAIDDKYKTIEVQYYDGDISEFEIEAWGALNVIETEAPEEAYAAYDGLSSYPDSKDMDMMITMGNNPLETIEPESFQGFDDLM